MRHRKPEELKETDVEWIEEIPKDWSLRKLKFLSEVNSSNVDKKSKEGEAAVKLCNYTDVYYNEFITNKLEFMEATASDKNIIRFQLKKGDVIITKDSESQDDMAVPALVKETKENLLCGYHLALIRSNENILSGDYLFRLFQSKKYREEFGNRSNGITRYGLGVHELKNIPIHVPELPEQRAIAAFLDRKTEAIDGLIQKKEQIIERLKEKRQALITRAVTKGLDPDAPMKNSGIEWLGEIPVEWDTKDLKFIAKIHSSNVNKKSKEGEEKVELCNYTDVYYNEFITNDLEFMEATAPDSKFDRYQLEVGDVIITKDSEDPNDIAVPALVTETKESLLCGYHLALIKCKDDILDEFLFRVFQSKKYREEFGNRCNGITRYGLGVHEIKNMEIVLPSIEEQEKINDSINREINQIDNVIQTTQKSIPKLEEYRQSIISAVVTGKVDVRKEAEKPISSEHRKEISNWDKFVLALEIIKRMQGNQHFGRIMLVKILFLIEYHLKIKGFKSKYQRWDHGPFDNQLINSVEYRLEKDGWINIDSIEETNYNQKIYTPTAKAYEKEFYYENSWSDLNNEVESIISIFKNADSTQAEIIATTYAAYNDLLKEGKNPSRNAVLNEILNDWHPNKRKIAKKRWEAAFQWIKNNNLVPTGFGKSTKEAT